MKFSRLVEQSGLAVDARNGDADISAVTADSRRCDSRSVFVAVRGTANDGHAFIPAAAATAAAIVCESPAAVPAGIPHAIVSDTQDALGRLAQAVHGWPSRQLACIGVTGTNGKTTVTHLIRNMLLRAGHKPALIGTISYDTGERTIPAQMTTPDAVTMAEMMAEMVRVGSTHVVMEASSHALDQKRTAGIDFDVAVFTNLSGDHLDYHGTMERYLAAKCEMFAAMSADAVAIVNRDDAAGEAMAEATSARVVWYGLSEAADVYGRVNHISMNGTVMQVRLAGRSLDVQSRLIGRHNVYNALAALAVVDALGVDANVAAEVLTDLRAIPGRLQPVPTAGDWYVFIDYAHTDDALANVLSALRPITRGRLIVVFGCGGDRDRGKRPRMAKVAEELADRIVVTTDNPRGEVPQAIIDEVVSGFSEAGRNKADIVLDRRDAIERAIEQALPGDVVLIAGKGHETYQLSRGQRTHFDDAEAAAECVARREGRA
jgi:UDP-N-acetylmuramoyl-L-alanyl-D-glutamate--2,6-diaminopimelate ligase